MFDLERGLGPNWKISSISFSDRFSRLSGNFVRRIFGRREREFSLGNKKRQKNPVQLCRACSRVYICPTYIANLGSPLRNEARTRTRRATEKKKRRDEKKSGSPFFTRKEDAAITNGSEKHWPRAVAREDRGRKRARRRGEIRSSGLRSGMKWETRAIFVLRASCRR